MKKIFSICFLFIVFFQSNQAQINEKGTSEIRNFQPEELLGAEQNWTVVQDDRGVVFVGTNDKGILEFDGSEWRQIEIPKNAAVRILAIGVDGIVYAGVQGDFGYLAPDRAGNMKYVSLLPGMDSTDHEVQTVYSIINWNQKIYFCEYGYIYEYDPDKGTFNTFDLKELGIQYGRLCFNVHNHFYLYDPGMGIYEFYGEEFVLVPGTEFFARKFVLGMLPYEGSKILVLTHMEGAFSYDPQSRAVETDAIAKGANDYIKAYRFYRGIRLPDGNYALGTLDGGLVVTDPEGDYFEVINKETGLENEVITSIYSDPDNPGTSQLWLALNIGVAKIEYFSPFRSSDDNQGLEGGINTIVEFNNTLVVGTRAGVFYLDSDESGMPGFQKVGGILSQCWSLMKFTHPGSLKPILWAGTEGGIFEISEDFSQRNIKDSNPGIGKDFLTYTLHSDPDDSGKVYVGTGAALNILTFRGNRWVHTSELNEMNGEIRSITRDRQGRIWVSASLRGIGMFDFSNPKDTLIKKFGTEEGLSSLQATFVYLLSGDIYAATDDGLYKYHQDSGMFQPDELLGPSFSGGGNIGIYRVSQGSDDTFYLSIRDHDDARKTNKVVRIDAGGTEISILDQPFMRLPSLSTEVIHVSEDGTVWLGVSDRLYAFNPAFERDYTEPFTTLIRNVSIGEDSVFFGGNFYEIKEGEFFLSKTQPLELIPSFKYRNNNLMFNWSSPYFDGEDRLEYSYRLVGFEDKWSRWSDRTEFPYTNIPRGNLTFEVKARNVYGVESNVAFYKFNIQPPWYQRIWAYFIYLAIAILLIVIIVKLYTRRLQHEKVRLEGIVRRRTAEVVRQKDELEDSITYASRIQKAILPSEKILNEQLPEHFIFFKPRDIVSGDFYWLTEKEDRIIIVAADCTGHGVPGAFMSLLGMSYLNEIVNKSDVLKSDEILNLLRKEIMTSLKQTGKEGEAKDGMDLALAICDKKAMKVQYSGAYNPMMIVRPLTRKEKDSIGRGDPIDIPERSIHNDEYVLIQVNADKMPIGISAKDLKPFTYNEVDVKKGYSIYMASDGYVDQFGGPEGKKFMSRAFKKMLLELQDQRMEDQGRILDERFEEWKGDLAQVDDILVIGIKFD